jgi:hypothetical protein
MVKYLTQHRIKGRVNVNRIPAVFVGARVLLECTDQQSASDELSPYDQLSGQVVNAARGQPGF